MFANCMMGGLTFGFPDICKTPCPPPAPFLPIPYPNFAPGPIGVPFVPIVLFMGAPGHNLVTAVPATAGDQGGVLGGLISSTFMSRQMHLTPVATVLVGGIPGTRLTAVGLSNTVNVPSVRIVPSQVKVLMLAP